MSQLNVKAVAIIGRKNNPVYLRNLCESSGVTDLSLHYMLHTVLDVMDALGESKTTPPSTDGYTGLLYALEDMNVYGFVSSTRHKFIVVLGLTETVPKDADIRLFLNKLHVLHVSLQLNPFYAIQDTRQIKSTAFDTTVDNLIAHGTASSIAS